MSSLPKLKAWLPSSARYWLIHLRKKQKHSEALLANPCIAYGCKLVPLGGHHHIP